MKANFEIKYIEVQWYDKDTIANVTESLVSLAPIYNEDSCSFECETTTYPNVEGLRGQLAIRLLKGDLIEPNIIAPDGSRISLSQIDDTDTGKTWWIEKTSWDSKGGYWRNSGINTAGTLELKIANQTCHVLIGSMDFNLEQLNSYLSSFKSDLWELILDDSSVIQTDRTVNSLGISEEVIVCIQHLVSHAEKILKTPKAELREVQAVKPRKLVKPVKRTFMELVSKSDQRFLTSRSTLPSYNISENKYVLFALERCYRIIKQIVTLSTNKSNRYQNTVDKLKNQYNEFSKVIKVDRDLVVKDLEKLRERCHIEYWQRHHSHRLQSSRINLAPLHNNMKTLHFRTQETSSDKNNGEKDGFFIELCINGIWGQDNGKATVLSCKYNSQELINCLEANSEYKITGIGNRKETQRAVIYSFSTLSIIELVDTAAIEQARKQFDKEKKEGKQLSENNWSRSLHKNELEEQAREKAALLNRVKHYENSQHISQYILDKVTPKQRKLLALIRELRKLKVTSSSYFPNSMTFVQNPHYQGVHNSYGLLRQITNLAEDELLLNLEEIDSIGLVNMPLLYERWTLLRIMSSLTESFKYKVKDDWKYCLIEAIKTNQTDIEINFANEDAKRFLKLTYEKTLDNGKRPDFVIDLTWFSESDHENKHAYTKRFVLDSKFYNQTTFNRFGGLLGVIDGLYNKKDYRESTDNPVFIIHPCKFAVPEKVTAQSWGVNSYLGELPLNNISIKPNHQYGAIYLSPVDRQIYSDELQRLLGLFLQYKLEDADTNHSSRPDDRTIAKPFCIRCGSSQLHQVDKTSGFYDNQGKWVTRTPRSVWMQCNDCEQFISFNHCKSTGTRLIKNGAYWTYHSARAIEPFNIKCPHCTEWGAW